MRTSTLQYLYLQKPVTMVVIICIISVLPWIGLGNLSAPEETREAAVAVSMLDSGNWILPQTAAHQFAYKPPMAHWLMAIFSYPQGYVSEFTSRLPSALAFITLIGFVLVFFGKRIVKFQEAFIATLLLITCVEIHYAAMIARVDMLFAAFIVLGLFQLYRWEDKLELKGLPVIIPLLLSGAVLTKGLIGAVLPLFVFGVYLLILKKYSYLTVFKSLLYMGISSMFLPLLWYVSAWKQGGESFANIALAENFGYFLRISAFDKNGYMEHVGSYSVLYNLRSLLTGFMPWTVFFVFSLFGLRLKRPAMSCAELLKDTWKRIRSMEKVRLFSLAAIVCTLFFYSLPAYKQSIYLIPAYPFIALFLSQYALYLTEYRTKVTRIFAAVAASVVAVGLIAVFLTMGGCINPVGILSQYTSDESLIRVTQHISNLLMLHSALTLFVITIVMIALGAVYYQMFKKINIKILYATIALTFAVNLFIELLAI